MLYQFNTNYKEISMRYNIKIKSSRQEAITWKKNEEKRQKNSFDTGILISFCLFTFIEMRIIHYMQAHLITWISFVT